jgi:hypothetical protein
MIVDEQNDEQIQNPFLVPFTRGFRGCSNSGIRLGQRIFIGIQPSRATVVTIPRQLYPRRISNRPMNTWRFVIGFDRCSMKIMRSFHVGKHGNLE